MINLLPPQEKIKLKKEENLKIALVLEIIFLFFLLFLFLSFLIINIVLDGELDIQKIILSAEKESAKGGQANEFKENIAGLAQDIQKMDTFYSKELYLSGVIEKISLSLPQGTYIDRLVWQKSSSKVELSGFAPQRDNLFELQRKLKEESSFINIDFPQSNWVKPNNIDFFVTFNIK